MEPTLTDQAFLAIVDATPLVSIDFVIRNERGQALLGKRLNRPAKDFWFAPGGRIRKNERVRDALKRISQRELGVTVSEARLIGAFDHIYDDNFLGEPRVNTHYVVLGHECRLPQDAVIQADDQHSELKWWDVGELLASPEVHENTKVYFRK
jgi:colanic acid biosynthesis protein WcaH